MSLNRFYDLSGLFGDDERIIAHAIAMYSNTKESPEEIHKDLLDCDFDKWEKHLEKATAELTKQAIIKFSEMISDRLRVGQFSKPDFQTLTESAWLSKEAFINKNNKRKIKSKAKVQAVKKNSLFEYYEV